jgi:ADP-heptose:LPS heptosyltransferase
MDLVPDVARIAVLRANGIGDHLFAVPALDALRAAYPRAEIVLLGQPWHADALRDRPGPVDDAVAVPPAEGIWTAAGAPPDPAALDRFVDGMRRRPVDLAVQLHGGGRFSNPLVSRLGARVTAGMRSEDAAPLDRWVRYVYWHHEVFRYLEVVRLVGAEPVGLEPRFHVLDRDRAEADAAAGSLPAPLVALNPGATDPRRRWPPDRFAAVGDALAGAGAAVVVTGDAGDVPLADGVVAAMRAPARSLAGLLSLGGLAALLERATLLVSNDTGPLHLAAAVGTATVGVYWAGNAVNAGPVTAGRHRPVLSWQLRCARCGEHYLVRRCEHDASFVLDVPVGEVAAAALDAFALERERERGTAGARRAS